jgi:DNA-binding FadR family transcriptional regulator
MGSIGPIIEAALNDASLKIPSPANSPQRQAIVVARHRAIADAIEARDPRAARAAMTIVVDEGLSDRVAAPAPIQVSA